MTVKYIFAQFFITYRANAQHENGESPNDFRATLNSGNIGRKRPINGGSCPWRGSLKCGACPAPAFRSVLCVSTYDVEGGPGWQHGGGLGHTAIYYNNACHLIFLYTHLLFNIFRRNVCDPIFNNVYGCFVNRCHKSSVNCEVISALVRVKCDTEPIH